MPPNRPPALSDLPPFETLEEGPIQDHRIFGVQSVMRRSPRTGKAGSYRVLHMPPWVNVIALTADFHVVLVEQYRHGVNEITLEIPGGMVEAGEDPGAAAARELLEETGFAGETPQLLGLVEPNPAIQTNVCGTWLVEEARRVSEPQPDEGEHLAVLTRPLKQIPDLMAAGQIRHALVVSGFHWLGLRRPELMRESKS